MICTIKNLVGKIAKFIDLVRFVPNLFSIFAQNYSVHITFDIDQKLFCSLVKHYSKTYDLPPLAGKIYAYLLFDVARDGLTFDDMVDIFSASKSSVSTSLNLLLSNKLVSDINKLDERKRYFVINEDFVKIRMKEIADRLSEEVKIVTELQKFYTGKSEVILGKSEAYKNVLKKNIENIEESLSKF